MMVDLYSLPRDFPGYDAGIAQASGRSQVIALEQSLLDEIGDDRFIPYLQLHEYEALVLAEPRRIGEVYEISKASIDTFCRVCDAYASPEEINHGQHSHPKYRIQQLVPDYDENVAGPLLAEAIGLPTLRQRCPHFGEWLAQLERLDVG